jgi:hypothetical protein
VLSESARNSVDSATTRWPDADRAWQAIEWAMARDSYVGVPLTESGRIRAFVYQGARSIGQPDVSVIYEVTPHEIIVRDAVFSDAKASQAGHA